MKSALIGIFSGLCIYAGAGILFPSVPEFGTEFGTVTPEVTGSANNLALGAKQVTGSAKNSGTKSGTDVALVGTVAPSLTPVPTLRVSVTPWPSGTFATPSKTPAPTSSPAATPTSSATPVPTPTPTPTPTPVITPTPQPSATGAVVLSEIAWAGTAASSADEWIELYNTTDASINLSGWTIVAADGAPSIVISGSIAAGDYFLIERTDGTATSVAEDWAGSFGKSGNLGNDGESLFLRDAGGVTIDSVDCAGGWFAGAASDGGYATMERVSAAGSGASNWASNDGTIIVGADSKGNPIHGTPRYQNSVAAPSGF